VKHRPADTARLIVWLLSDDANWITGQVIAADGGLVRRQLTASHRQKPGT